MPVNRNTSHQSLVTALLAALLLLSFSAVLSADTSWRDDFTSYDMGSWSDQGSGFRMAKESVPLGVVIKDGALVLDEASHGVRLTSRRKFLYGTLEMRIKVNPSGLQYLGFMSRSPWGAHNLSIMSSPGSWDLMRGRDGKGGYANIGFAGKDDWMTIKIVWEKSHVVVYADGVLKGEIKDESLIPQTPVPLILDSVAGHPITIDYIQVTGGSDYANGLGEAPAAVPLKGKKITLKSSGWSVDADSSTGAVISIRNLAPSPLTLTPKGVAGLDLYVCSSVSGRPISLECVGKPILNLKGNNQSLRYGVKPANGPLRDVISGYLELVLSGSELKVKSVLKTLVDLNEPVEIGLGVPTKAEIWRSHTFARLPWLALSPKQTEPIRFTYLADPNDATVPTNTGNWIYYPMGILDGENSTIFWGGMDIGKRMVLAPDNRGCLSATTLAPRKWPKGKLLELSMTLKGFPKAQNGLSQIIRWYLSNCISSDPLTKDLFPVKDWTPRVLPSGGGVGMPDVRISEMNPKYDLKFWDDVKTKLLKYDVPNLWYGSWHAINGTYPVSGEWIAGTGLNLKADEFKKSIQSMKSAGLRPCLYTFQFIVPELLKEGEIPSKNWIAYASDGTMSLFDSYVAGEGKMLGDFFNKELAGKIGSNVITLAYGDYGRAEYRKWLTDSLKAAIDYYEPSGICFDYGWGVLGPYSVYSSGNTEANQAHGRLRVQADIWKWLQKNHPEMQVMINDSPGSPSQLFANCMLLESSDVMSDVDFLAGKALGSAMSSMDYFANHNRTEWAARMMSDLARGCSIGLPFWIMTSPPEADYVATWQTFLEFSGRTTKLPILIDPDILKCDNGLTGTVWSDGRNLMAAVFNTDTKANERQAQIAIKLPSTIAKDSAFHIDRLNSENVKISSDTWKSQREGNSIQLSGPLAPGEMVLIDSAH